MPSPKSAIHFSSLLQSWLGRLEDYWRVQSVRWMECEAITDGAGCLSLVRVFPLSLRQLKSNGSFSTEGVATCLIAILFYFLISDFPEEAKWLTPEERDYVKLRLRKDVGASLRHESMTPREIITVIKECEYTRVKYVRFTGMD